MLWQILATVVWLAVLVALGLLIVRQAIRRDARPRPRHRA